MQEKRIVTAHGVYIFGLSQVIDGNMILADKASSGRLALFQKKQNFPKKLARADLIHSVKVLSVSRSGLLVNCDGLMTDKAGLTLALTAADCAPIFIYDNRLARIALLHAGWRGVADGILKNGLKSLLNKGSRLADLHLFIGPHLRVCHFEIGSDLVEVFKDYPQAIKRQQNKFYLNLSLVLKKQALQAGLSSEQIKISRECTYCSVKKYYSYRRQGEPLRTMIAYAYYESA